MNEAHLLMRDVASKEADKKAAAAMKGTPNLR